MLIIHSFKKRLHSHSCLDKSSKKLQCVLVFGVYVCCIASIVSFSLEHKTRCTSCWKFSVVTRVRSFHFASCRIASRSIEGSPPASYVFNNNSCNVCASSVHSIEFCTRDSHKRVIYLLLFNETSSPFCIFRASLLDFRFLRTHARYIHIWCVVRSACACACVIVPYWNISLQSIVTRLTNRLLSTISPSFFN